MTIQLGTIAPDVIAKTTAGPISFHARADGDWVVLFSQPNDFTPAGSSELVEAARLKPQFDKRGVKLVSLSVETLGHHDGGAADIADTDRAVSTLYGTTHAAADPSLAVRSVCVINPARKLRPSLFDADAKDRFPQGWTAQKPHLRWVEVA